jgi:mycothione reductase
VRQRRADCRDDGLDYACGIAAYSDVAFGWAMQDEDGFCKVLAERGTGRLLGAHIIGPNASILIQPLVLAMVCGIDVTTVATRPYWIHPALTEVVENALRTLDLLTATPVIGGGSPTSRESRPARPP